MKRLLSWLAQWLGSDRRTPTPSERCRANRQAITEDFEAARKYVIELDAERRKRRGHG